MVRLRNTFLSVTVILTTAVFLLLSATFVYASPEEVGQIREAIKAKGAKWHADETSVSNLTMKEKKLRLGAGEGEDFLGEALSSSETAPIPLVTAAPPTLDWRGVEGVSYVTPVKNQGSCGSCWAFATTAGLESQVMISTAGMPIDISEQILVSCSGMGNCSGGSSAGASNYIRDVGLPLESCLPYTASNSLCANACANWQENAYGIHGWHSAYTTAKNAEAIKSALYAYGPVVATMYVYNDFFSYRSGVYSYTTGAYVGAHAVLIVGYDDILQAFIVKNSWGTGWGEAGYFMIAYSELAGTSKFAYSTMVYDGYGDNPAPDPVDPPVDPQPAPCTYSLSATSATFKAAGGSGGFSLYAQGSCSLASLIAQSNAAWVTITSTSSLSSGIAVSYSVAVNTGAARSTTIEIGGLLYTVNQQKALPNKAKK
jgi:C1A family cysteine protease